MAIFLEIPGPTWYQHHLKWGLQQRWPSNPRAVFEGWLANLTFLLSKGVAVVLVPPSVDVLTGPGLPETHADWQDLGRRDPLLALAHLRQAPGGLTAVDWWPGQAFADGRPRVVAANRSSQAAAPGLSATMVGFWQNLVANHVVVDAGAPGCFHLADEGWPSHLQLCGTEGGVGHLLAHQRAWSMPQHFLPRKGAVLQSREAHELILSTLGVKPGATVLARMLWKAADGGARWLQDLVCAGPGRALIHETAIAEGLKVVSTLEQLVPDCRCHLIARRDLSLRKAMESGFFTGLLCPVDDGLAYIGPQAALSVGARVLKAAQKSGWLKESHSWPANVPAARAIDVPALGVGDVRTGLVPDADQLKRLAQWGAGLPEEVSPKVLLEGPDPRTQLEDLAAICS